MAPASDDTASPGGARAHAAESSAPPDWRTVRGQIERIARAKLRGLPSARFDEEVDEAWIKVFNACERSRPENLDAFVYTITVRHCASAIRSWQRWKAVFEPDASNLDDIAAPGAGYFGDPRERLERAVLAFFRTFNSTCHELAIAYFEEIPHTEVARRGGLRPNTVTQRWARCVALLRKVAARDSSFLFRWAEQEG